MQLFKKGLDSWVVEFGLWHPYAQHRNQIRIIPWKFTCTSLCDPWFPDASRASRKTALHESSPWIIGKSNVFLETSNQWNWYWQGFSDLLIELTRILHHVVRLKFYPIKVYWLDYHASSTEMIWVGHNRDRSSFGIFTVNIVVDSISPADENTIRSLSSSLLDIFAT